MAGTYSERLVGEVSERWQVIDPDSAAELQRLLGEARAELGRPLRGAPREPLPHDEPTKGQVR